jgi:murein DD-endopeptidase MepM/ murein hydrolase activator NlpD
VTALRHSLLLIVYLLGLPALAAAAESCAQGMGTVCLDAVQSGSSVSISADNHETYDVTVTVNAVLDNMTASVKLPYTRSLDGKFKGALLTFTANPQGAWRWNYSFHWTPGSVDAHHDDSVIYDLPYVGTHTVIQGFHGAFSHTGDFEYANDWEMPVGTAIYAAREGIVVGTRSSMTDGGPDRKYQDYANFIMIRHADGTIGSYDHLKEDGVVVKVGDRISRKKLIGYSGNTGFTSRPHLHFMIFRAVDGFTRQSFPMRFQTASGIITPQQGQSYSSLATDLRPQSEFPQGPGSGLRTPPSR